MLRCREIKDAPSIFQYTLRRCAVDSGRRFLYLFELLAAPDVVAGSLKERAYRRHLTAPAPRGHQGCSQILRGRQAKSTASDRRAGANCAESVQSRVFACGVSMGRQGGASDGEMARSADSYGH
eukprot:882978-Rhodomonas_salina.4